MRRPLLVFFAAASLVFPAAAGAAPAPLDTVSATGNSAFIPARPPRIPALQYREIQISAQSGTSGENPTGTASFTFALFHLSGPVTCLRVRGPDRGAGTATAPTTAVLQFVDQPPDQFAGSVISVELVDNGGNGQDVFRTARDVIPRDPTDCTSPWGTEEIAPLSDGRGIVFDAPPRPARKDQCKNGGWQAFGVFNNQGDCVRFVRHQARQECILRRSVLGGPAFRAKYGTGSLKRHAWRGCIRARMND
jgi:hypothetical protein